MSDVYRAAMLHAVAGLVPAGQLDLNPELNAIQMLVARREDQFHGRPEAVKALTNELRALV